MVDPILSTSPFPHCPQPRRKATAGGRPALPSPSARRGWTCVPAVHGAGGDRGADVSPFEFDQQDFALIGSPGPINAAHWLGTDELGRDMLTRLIQGGRVSLAVGLAGAVLATFVGTLIGALSGFYRGWTDALLMRFTDVMLSIPTLPLVLLLSGLLRRADAARRIVGSLIWMGTARLVRSQFLALREREFVEAARALGAGGPRLMLRHILPNAIGPITVAATLAVGHAILLEFDPQLPRLRYPAAGPELGEPAEYRQLLAGVAPVARHPPGLCILFTVLSVNFLGDGLRDALEPRD